MKMIHRRSNNQLNIKKAYRARSVDLSQHCKTIKLGKCKVCRKCPERHHTLNKTFRFEYSHRTNSRLGEKLMGKLTNFLFFLYNIDLDFDIILVGDKIGS